MASKRGGNSPAKPQAGMLTEFLQLVPAKFAYYKIAYYKSTPAVFAVVILLVAAVYCHRSVLVTSFGLR